MTLESLAERHVRFGEGVTLLVAGLALLVPTTVLRAVVAGHLLDLVTLAAYGVLLVGILRCYGATRPTGEGARAGATARS